MENLIFCAAKRNNFEKYFQHYKVIPTIDNLLLAF